MGLHFFSLKLYSIPKFNHVCWNPQKHVEDNEEPPDQHNEAGLSHSQALPEVLRDLLKVTTDIRKETSA